MSIHIEAERRYIAPTVLLSGDPLRAKWVAETFLRDVIRYNTVRNMLGYTGFTKDGRWVSVQGSGMGQPSLGIYVHELINEYNVGRIIRIGSAGSLQNDLAARSIVLGMTASTDSAMNQRRFAGMSFAPAASWELLLRAYEVAGEMNIPVTVGNIFATDTFYEDIPQRIPDEPPGAPSVPWHEESWRIFARYGVCAIEMESAELYTVAAREGVEALTILTISDTLARKEAPLSAEERESGFFDMARIALAL